MKGQTQTRRGIAAALVPAIILSILIVVALPAGAPACGFTKWYLPEGYTGGNFDTYILIQNPNEWETEASVRFFTGEGVTDPVKYELEGNSRTTIMVDEQPGLADANVSTMVEASSGVVVERAMYFNYEGGRAGGSNSIGANCTSRTWYLAEGYTGGAFDTYILVMNPNDVPVRIKTSFFTPSIEGAGGVAESGAVTREYDVDAMRRFTIRVDDIEGLSDTDVSTKVEVVGSGSGGELGVHDENGDETEELPGVVAERAMYFDYMGVDGGHCSIGAPAPSSTWYLPEGRTAGEFDTYVLVMNPNAYAAKVKATFMVPADGAAGAGERRANPYDPEPSPKPEPEPAPEPEEYEVVTREFTLGPFERYTIPVDGVEGLGATDVATMVESWAAEGEGAAGAGGCCPVVVERSMYFARGNDGDGHNTMGATVKHEYWLLAEGYTAEGFDSWILVMNPNAYTVKVKATFMTKEGEPVEREYLIGAMSRLTIPVDGIEGLEAAEVSAKIQVLGPAQGRASACEYGIIAERAMYFEYNGVVGGHCSMGVGE
jgi:hypothetical protein